MKQHTYCTSETSKFTKSELTWLFLCNSVPRSLVVTALAGLLVGFGTRIGNSCTSGHVSWYVASQAFRLESLGQTSQDQFHIVLQLIIKLPNSS